MKATKNQSIRSEKTSTAIVTNSAAADRRRQQLAAARAAKAAKAAKKAEEAAALEQERQRAAAEEAAKERATAAATAAALKTAKKEQNRDGKKELAALEGSPLYCLHYLNRLARKGAGVAGINTAALTATAAAIDEMTPTAAARTGFSYDVLPVDYKGRVCRLVPYTPATGDEVREVYAGGYLIATTATTRQYQAAQLVTRYTGSYLLAPVTVSPKTVLAAVNSYTDLYTATAADLLTTAIKDYNRRREAEKAATAATRAAEAADRHARRIEAATHDQATTAEAAE
ncbi:MAG: hypothetical protein IJ557_02740, partial [Bacteroidaceae bacterium]|nr:hypothetical protein [Bacteroidaceae bacterium]